MRPVPLTGRLRARLPPRLQRHAQRCVRRAAGDRLRKRAFVTPTAHASSVSAVVTSLPTRILVVPELLRAAWSALCVLAVYHESAELSVGSFASVTLHSVAIYLLTLFFVELHADPLAGAHAWSPGLGLCPSRLHGARNHLVALLQSAAAACPAPPLDSRSLVGLTTCAYVLAWSSSRTPHAPFASNAFHVRASPRCAAARCGARMLCMFRSVVVSSFVL